MRLLLLAPVIFFAQTALALPHVGDAASYDLQVGQQLTRVQRELVSVDSARNQCVIKDMNLDVITQKMVDCSQIDGATYTPEMCAKIGGVMDVINVVAGQFQACRVYSGADQKTVTYLGNVPFGVIYFKSTSAGGDVVLQLHGLSVEK